MTLHIYLHEDIVRILRMIDANLNNAVNIVLEKLFCNNFPTDIPSCRQRDPECSLYAIKVWNEDYLILLSTHSKNSSKFSLRRLLYWFVENEMYEAYDIRLQYNDSKEITALKKQLAGLPYMIRRCQLDDDTKTQLLQLAKQMEDKLNE